MKTRGKILSVMLVLAMSLTLLSACTEKTSPVSNGNTESTAPTASAPNNTPDGNADGEPENIATLVADLSLGDADGEEHNLISRYEYGYDGLLSVEILAQGLSELTGLNFAVNDSSSGKGGVSVDWSADAAFIAGLGDITQKDEFFVYDHESLAWFMMDSMYRTILENFDGEDLEVYYSMDGGQPIVLGISYPPIFPVETPYMGSPFYSNHVGGRGDDFPDESDWGDLPYWNGFDFGPNLSYSEEYEIQGDPGEYLNAAEAAKLTFDTMKANGNIPEYSDGLEYEMVLVDLADIEGEECYVYRLDVGEPSGTIGAAYAYAYQSGNIYMQGYGGQWVMPE
ncbi:MAG: hypothetical protein LBS84_00685 [Clostridiales bacterium]|jgi:hypothetical protein|nr:hypothetical protein [Clostridiales bacterium]